MFTPPLVKRLLLFGVTDYSLPQNSIHRHQALLIVEAVTLPKAADMVWQELTQSAEAQYFVNVIFGDLYKRIDVESLLKKTSIRKLQVLLQTFLDTFKKYKPALPAGMRYFCSKVADPFTYLFPEWLSPILCEDYATKLGGHLHTPPTDDMLESLSLIQRALSEDPTVPTQLR